MAARRKVNQHSVTRDEIASFDKTLSQMQQLVKDMEALAKKSPDGPVSKFKLGIINEQLRRANAFLKPPFKPIEGFDEFDAVGLPSNSDVVLVLSQYLTCFEKWRSGNIHREGQGYDAYWAWNVRGETIRTTEPTTATHDANDEDD